MSSSASSGSLSHHSLKKLSTFSAVFLPVTLTLLGVILFLRMGWIVSIAGPFATFCVITLTMLVAFTTALSISSIATNMTVGSGGIYFILSRTFGIEVSSAISLPLFLAQSFSVSFYIMGFSEIISYLFPMVHIKLFNLLILCGLTLITCFTEKIIAKGKLFFITVLVLGFLSFFLGYHKYLENSESFSPSLQFSFWALFALFFPAFTGIEGGLSLSKNLKNPSKSIPKGMILSIIFSYLIYLAVTFFLYFHASKGVLFTNSLIMKNLALVPELVLITICVSTLSGAISMLITAPIMLEALAIDRVIPEIIGKGYGRSNLPRFAILVTFAIALMGLSMEKMNTLAPILTMFFLISYFMINLATALEAMIANPSWRPTFKIPWYVSFIGAILCLIIMLMINPGITLISFSFILILYFIMKKRHLSTRWEDFRHSLLLFLARFAVYRLSKLKSCAKTWRPHLLVFVGDPLLRSHLISLTSSLTHKKGFLTMTSIIDHNQNPSHEIIEEKKLSLFLEKARIPAIISTFCSDNLLNGMIKMIEYFGIGGISPNTIVLGATKDKEKFPLFAEVIKTAYEHKKNILIINEPYRKPHIISEKKQNIDVWWAGGSKNNPELMLALAYMLQNSAEWKGSSLTLKTAVSSDDDLKVSEEKLKELTVSARLNILTQVVKHDLKNDIFKDTIQKSSQNSDLIFLGLRAPFKEETSEHYAKYYENLIEKIKNFPTTIFVLCGEDLEFSKIFN